MNRRHNINARSSPDKDTNIGPSFDDLSLEKFVNSVAAELKASNEPWLFTGGLLGLCLLSSLITFSPTIVPLVYLGFAVVCLPYRFVTFVSRKWTFFLVDFCYFANLACCAFLVLRPEDRRLEAAVYALCEGPLAAALIAWQCAWVLNSPNHVISVLIHQLPGLALYCHRYLAFSRQPSLLATHIGLALVSDTDPWGGSAAGGGMSADSAASDPRPAGLAARWARRLATAAAVARGRVPCPAFAAAPVISACASPADGPVGQAGTCPAGMDAAASVVPSGVGVECSAAPAAGPAPPCPAPAWLWLGVAPVAFYLAWQLLYFLIVQVVCRRIILAGGYDTSYTSLARRAKRANSPLNRLVRRGSVARRLFMYGFLQFLFTLVAQALAVATYHSFAAATVWQVFKWVHPLYLGACHHCRREPVQQLKAAATRLAAAGALRSGAQQSKSDSLGPPRAVALGAEAEAALERGRARRPVMVTAHAETERHQG